MCLSLDDGTAPQPALERLLAGVGGLEPWVHRGGRVLIKPNFVAPFPAATTDLAVVAFFVEAVRRHGGVPIVGESSGFEFDTQATFRVLGVEELARRLNVALVNFEAGGYDSVDLGAGLGSVEVARAAVHADLIVNLPVLKGHSVTLMTGAVKNLFGVLSKPSRRRVHAVGLHRAIHALARHLEPKCLHFVDARRLLRRAVFAPAEPLGYVLASSDAFALDHLGCGLLGVLPEQVRHLGPAPRYTIDGDAPRLPEAPRRPPLSYPLRRAAYAASYAFDHLQSRLFRGPSLLPVLHWHFGVHPELAPALSPQQIAEVARSCPVGAIAPDGTIRRNLCAPVRCLSCERAHPNLVQLRGLRPPTPSASHASTS